MCAIFIIFMNLCFKLYCSCGLNPVLVAVLWDFHQANESQLSDGHQNDLTEPPTTDDPLTESQMSTMTDGTEGAAPVPPITKPGQNMPMVYNDKDWSFRCETALTLASVNSRCISPSPSSLCVSLPQLL